MPHSTGPAAELRPVPEADWNGWLQHFADANLYQTYAYGAESWGPSQTRHLVIHPPGQPQPLALAQLRLVQFPFLRTGIAHIRGGPLCQPIGQPFDPVAFHSAVAALAQELVHRQRLVLRLLPPLFAQDPHAPQALDTLRQLGFQPDPSAPAYRTFRVDLNAPPEVIRRRFDGKWRNQLNAAERNSLNVLEGTSTQLYDQFLVLYDEMMARKRFDTTVDPRTFARIQHRLPDAQRMIVLLSLLDDRPQTALIGAALGHTGVYLLGATGAEGMRSKGSYLLQWHLLQRLRERGCQWYDLGGINPDANPGVYHFKQGMGGTEANGLGAFVLAPNPLLLRLLHFAESTRRTLARCRRRLPWNLPSSS